jgi:hypothetical protein
MLADFLMPHVRLSRICINHKRIQNPDQAYLKCFGSGFELRILCLIWSHFAQQKFKISVFGHEQRLLPDPYPNLKLAFACARTNSDIHSILLQNVSFLKNCVEASQLRLCL